jgi:hypothetical protein
MCTLIEKSSILAKTFIRSKNKTYAAKILIAEISSLLYSNTKEPLDFTLKTVIVQVISDLLSGKRAFVLPGKEPVALKPKDYSKFSELEGYILHELWQQHECQEKKLADARQSMVSVKTFTLNVNTSDLQIDL